MNINEVLLQEGLVFFKESKKIERTINTIEKRLKRQKISLEEKEKIDLVVKNLKILYNKFSKIEKDKNKEKYEELKNTSKDLLNVVNKEEFKKILKNVGIFFLISMAIFGILFGLKRTFDDLTPETDLPNPYDKYRRYYESLGKDNLLKTDYSNNKLMKSTLGIKEMILDICEKEKADPKMIAAIIQKESGFNPDAISPGKDIGLMQLNRKYIPWFITKFWDRKEKFDPMNPEHNAIVGIRYYQSLLKMFNGDKEKALQAYNQGPTAVKEGRVLRRAIAYANDIIKKSS